MLAQALRRTNADGELRAVGVDTDARVIDPGGNWIGWRCRAEETRDANGSREADAGNSSSGRDNEGNEGDLWFRPWC